MRRPFVAPPESEDHPRSRDWVLPPGVPFGPACGLVCPGGEMAGHRPTLVWTQQFSRLLAARNGVHHGDDPGAETARIRVCDCRQQAYRGINVDALGGNPLPSAHRAAWPRVDRRGGARPGTFVCARGWD